MQSYLRPAIPLLFPMSSQDRQDLGLSRTPSAAVIALANSLSTRIESPALLDHYRFRTTLCPLPGVAFLWDC